MRREQSEARSPRGSLRRRCAPWPEARPSLLSGAAVARAGARWAAAAGSGPRGSELGARRWGSIPVISRLWSIGKHGKAPPWLTRSSFQLSKPGGRELQPLHAGKELRESVRPNSSAPRSTPQKSRAQNILHGSRGGVHVHGKKR
jgi:hypothetical protein